MSDGAAKYRRVNKAGHDNPASGVAQSAHSEAAGGWSKMRARQRMQGWADRPADGRALLLDAWSKQPDR